MVRTTPTAAPWPVLSLLLILIALSLVCESLRLFPLHLSRMSLYNVRLELYRLDVVPSDKNLRMLAECQPCRRRHQHIGERQVHVGVCTQKDAVVRLAILGFHEDLGGRAG